MKIGGFANKFRFHLLLPIHLQGGYNRYYHPLYSPVDSKFRPSADLFCKTIQEVVRDVQEYQRSIESFTFFLNGDFNFTHNDWLPLGSDCS